MSRTRSTIRGEKRVRIYERDGYACKYCGVDLPRQGNRDGEQLITLDHVIPVALGGTSERWNVVTCCAPCNQAKGATVRWDMVPAWVVERFGSLVRVREAGGFRG